MHRFHPTLALFLGATLAWPAAALAQGATVYRCPGNVYTSSADISAKEAEAKGCKTIEGAPITVIQGPQPRPRSGTVVAARPMMIFKRSPKAEQAKRFVDYVLSDEGQRIVAKSYLLPARSDVPALRPALGSFQAWPPESDAQRAGRAALLQRFDELFVRK